MSAFTEKRAEVQAELTTLSGDLQERLADAGRRIVESGSLPQEEPYTTLLERDRNVTDRVDELRTTHERIVSIGDRLAELGRSHDELEKRRREIGSELEPHYQTIGENSFRVFRDNPLVDQEYADIFTPVLDAAEEIKQSRAELGRAESEIAEKPFLEKMVLRGRIIVLRNRLSLRETQLERLYRDAGRQIAGTDFITTIGDPGLDEAAAPFLDLMEESQRIDREIAQVDEETGALRRELVGLGVDKRPAARINELDREIERAEQERRDLCAEIATAARSSEPIDTTDDDVAGLFEGIAKTESDLERARDRLTRLDAAIEAERLNAEVDQLDGAIGRKRKQVEALTADINELEEKKAGIRARVEEAERTRGAVDDLLE